MTLAACSPFCGRIIKHPHPIIFCKENNYQEDLDSFLVIAVLNFYGLNCVIHWFESIIAKENFLIFVKEVVNKRFDSTLGKPKLFDVISKSNVYPIFIESELF